MLYGLDGHFGIVSPTYDQKGLWAAVSLLELMLVQGIGIGGGYGGAVLMAVEYAPQGRRGFFGSWPQVGVPAGLFFGTIVFSLASLLPDQAIFAWGWRVAFPASILLVVVGLYVRLQILETPAFTRVREEQARIPFMEMLRAQPKEFVLCMGRRWIEGLAFNTFGVFSISYVVTQLELSRTVALTRVMTAAACGVVLVPVYGVLSDRFGRRPVYSVGAVLFGLWVVPALLLINTREPGLIYLSIIVALGLIYPPMYAPLGTFWSEVFATRIRYTGVGSVYQFSGIFTSTLTPAIVTASLMLAGGAPWLFVG